MSSSAVYKSVTHVIFDLDGLLLDTEKMYGEYLAFKLSQIGKTLTPELRAKLLGKTVKEGAQTLINDIGLSLSVEEALHLWDIDDPSVFKTIKFMPGSIRLLDYLHENSIPMAVATSSSSQSYNLKTTPHSHIFLTDKYFHHAVTAGDDPEVKTGKPAPDTFLVCAARFDPPPADLSKVLVFEDSTNGVKSALAAGMQCVHVPDPSIFKCNDVQPTLTIPSLNDFKPQLFGLPAFKH